MKLWEHLSGIYSSTPGPVTVPVVRENGYGLHLHLLPVEQAVVVPEDPESEIVLMAAGYSSAIS